MSNNPFFTVKRERLHRKDGEDTRHDALYRVDNGQQLSVVGERYNLIPHRDVVDFLHKVVDVAGLENYKRKIYLANDGAKLFYELRFPDHRFDPTAHGGGRGTARDSGDRRVGGLFEPTVTGINSYDGSSPAGFDYGAQRLVCLNGAKVFTRIHEIRIKHAGKDKVNFEEYAVPMLENIERTIEGVKVNYKRLNQESGNPYLEMVLIEQTLLAYKYQRELEQQLAGYVNIEWEKDDEKSRVYKPVGFNIKKDFSAYLLWCVLTSIATHRVKSVVQKRKLQAAIAKTFMK